MEKMSSTNAPVVLRMYALCRAILLGFGSQLFKFFHTKAAFGLSSKSNGNHTQKGNQSDSRKATAYTLKSALKIGV